jgi:hypothetical protein
MADTFGDLPTCSSGNDGTVAFVSAPPSLYACVSGSWNAITCSSSQAGEVAYSSNPAMLWACVGSTWTAIGLPDAGPPGPTGPTGSPGAKSLILVTNVDPGSPHCAGGGIRIEIGLDNNNDNILQSTEVLNTSYVCNGVSAGSDSGDSGDAAPTKLQAYASQYAHAFCSGFAKCCPGGDAGAFDVESCAASSSFGGGWRSTLPFSAQALTADNMLLDNDAGANCIAALQNMGCTVGGTMTAAAFSAVTTACNGVLTGTIPTGSSGCVSSFECTNGYCNLPTDGGAGTCTALAGAGGACAAGNDSPDQMCSQAGTRPALWCDLLDHPDGVGATCIAPFSDGTTCFTTSYWDDYGCASGICGDDSTCGTPATYPDPGFCAFWTPADAGH